MSQKEMFEDDKIWETEAVRFSKQVEDELRKNGSGQSTIVKKITEDSIVKIPAIATAENSTVKIADITTAEDLTHNFKDKENPDIPTAEDLTNNYKDKENLHTISQEQDEALEESEWAFEAQLHDAAGVGPEDYKIVEKYYKANKKN